MKIENYRGTADTFVFSHPPMTFDEELTKFIDTRAFPYAFTYMGTTNQVKSKRSLSLVGHFDGDDRLTEYRSLNRHVSSPFLKKVYFDDSKFYIAMGANCKKTPVGNQPRRLDYVSNWISPIGILFSSTQKTGLKNSSEQNDGDVFTPFEEITGTVTINDDVVIADADGNGIKFTASQSGTFTLYLIKQTTQDGDNYFTEYIYGEIDGDSQIIQANSTSKSMILGLETLESINDIFSAGTVTNITPTFKFRDGFSSE